MKTCYNCGTPLAEWQPVCPACGLDTAVIPDNAQKEEQIATLLFRMIKGERLAWLIGGGVSLLWAVILTFLAWFLFSSNLSTEIGLNDGDMLSLFFDLVMAWVSGVVSVIMGLRITPVLDVFFCDIRPAYDRCTSVKNIVVAALFNEVALIFVIINFVTAKRNRAIIGQIIHNQLHHHGGHRP